MPKASLQMPVLTVKQSELFCNVQLLVLVIPLSYNLLLLLLCAVYGFLTRKLPANFNESWYIFISVWTTMLLWIVLLPTYFTMFYAYYKAALLSFCLFMNALLTIMCMYVPKLYAIYFVDEGRFCLTTGGTVDMATKGQVAPNRTTTKINVTSTNRDMLHVEDIE